MKQVREPPPESGLVKAGAFLSRTGILAQARALGGIRAPPRRFLSGSSRLLSVLGHQSTLTPAARTMRRWQHPARSRPDELLLVTAGGRRHGVRLRVPFAAISRGGPGERHLVV